MREMKDSGIEWIGEIPKEWKIIRMKNMIVSREGGAWGEDKANNENDVICLRIADFDYSKLRFKDSNQLTIRNYKPEIKKRLLLSQDDILLEKSGGGEKTPVGRAVIFDKKYEALFANFMERLRTNKNTNPKYFLYILTAFYQNKHMLNYIKQTTGIQNLDINSLLSIEYSSFPPTTEQQKISAYLDDKCTKIDSIIEKQEKVIEKLKAYKLSVLTEAVTKGLNPDVKMKDSGVQWIGEIPEHWEITSIARIATVVRGASPRPAGDPLYFNGSDVPWITVAEVTKDEGKYIYETETFLTCAGAEKSRIVEKGTLILSNSGATLGVPKITCITGCINDGSLAFYDLKINQTYLLYTFKGRTYELRKQMQGYGQPNLNTSIVKAIQIPLPPEKEEVEICNYLDKKCTAIDSAIEKKQALIEKLKEYKKSLIYEVVTGKREVYNPQKTVTVFCPVGIPTNEEEYAKILLMQKIITRCGKNLKGRTHLMKIFHALELEIGFSFHSEYTRHYHGPYDKKIEKYEKALERKGWIKLKKEGNMKYIVVNPTAYKTDYNRIFAEYNKEIERIIDFFKKMTRTSKAEKVATLLASWNDFLIDGIAEPTDDMIITDVMTNWTENKRNIDYETWQEVLDRMKKANIVPHGYGKHTIRMED